MSRCCIIDENNKMIPLSEQEMKNILKNGTTSNDIIHWNDKSYEYIKLSFDEDSIRILKDITKLENLMKQNEELKRENHGLKKDNLTKLYRADCAMKVVREYILNAYQNGIPFSIVMGDIDKFKSINDNYGHETGNIVLKSIGECLLNNIRTTTSQIQVEKRKNIDFEKDIIIRYGGEEILFLFKNINLSHTIERIENIRKQIETLNPGNISVTMSFGIFYFEKQKNTLEITEQNLYRSVSKLVHCADKAMYHSKENGRNLTSVYDNDKCYVITKKR